MKTEDNKEIVYKHQIITMFLWFLEIAGIECQGSTNFEQEYMKRLKFQKVTDWKRFRACVDLLDDTEYALFSAFKYQLGDVRNNNNDIGEKYIRLYGILNAVFLQIGAFREISSLLHFQSKKEIENEFYKLDIYKLRGMAGSHTVDYYHDEETLNANKLINKKTSFRIVQVFLKKDGRSINVIDENNVSFKFNLLDILLEYNQIATRLLASMIRHSIENLITKKEQKIEGKRRLEAYLSNLIDYSTIDENKAYREEQMRHIDKTLKDFKDPELNSLDILFRKRIDL